MLHKARNVLLGALGLLVITFPFLWLNLKLAAGGATVSTDWSGGFEFFRQLAPGVSIVLFVVILRQVTKRVPALQFLDASKVNALPAVQWARHQWWLPILLVAMLIGLGVGNYSGRPLDDVWLDRGCNVGFYMLLALGLNVTVGMTGLLVLGYAGFSAFGAYAFAVAKFYFPWLEWWMAAPFVFLLGGLLGFLMGLPCLRLRGDYLAIVTLGFGETFRELLKNITFTNGDLSTGGDMGISIPAKGAYSVLLQQSWVAVVISVAIITVALYRLYHSPVGRCWIAIREDETAAGAMGIPVVRMKLLAFSLSAAIAAYTGVLLAQHIYQITPSLCNFSESVLILAMVILGGLGSLPGVMLGALLLYLVPELLKGWVDPEYRFLIFGAVMVAMMIYRPQGLLGSKRHQLELQPEEAK